MQTRTKQRAMGAMVIVMLAAIGLALLFSHPLPGITHAGAAPAATTEDGQLVYDLNLQATKQAEAEAASEEDELVPLHPLSEEEMRQRASATNTVTEKLLRTSGSPMVIAEKQKENLKEVLDNEEETLAELNHEDKAATAVGVIAAVKAAPNVAQQTAAPAVTEKNSVNALAAASSAPVDSARDSATKQVSSENVPLAWVVQIGSFSDKQNAMRLVEVLRSMKLDVYTRSVGAADKSSVKVFVGPFIERQDVEKAQQDLERELNLKGVVKKYSLS